MTAAVVMLLARWTPYLETEMLGLASLVRPGSVCFDVGSAAGLYTLALSQLVGPLGQVHSVEPLCFAHPLWTRVLRSRQSPNVSHHPVALGSEPGSQVMSVPLGRYGPVTGRSFLEWKSLGLGSNAEFADQIEVVVEVGTLDSLCADAGLKSLDFVKVDVEGAELHVLEGGQQVIESFKPDLLIEVEARHTARYQYSPDDIVEWLAHRGYTMHSWHQGWSEVGTWHEAASVCAHSRNYLFRARAPGDGKACAPSPLAPEHSAKLRGC